MAGETTNDLQNLIDRLKSGDGDARWELLERAYQRHRALVAKILGDFPRIRMDPAWQTTDITHESRLRLIKSIEAIELANPQHFFRLAAVQIRWFLLDLVRRLPKNPQESQAEPPGTRRRYSNDQMIEAMLEQLATLPSKQYEILDQEFIFGLSVPEIALALGVNETTVRRNRRLAYEAIGAALEKQFPGMEGGLNFGPQ